MRALHKKNGLQRTAGVLVCKNRFVLFRLAPLALLPPALLLCRLFLALRLLGLFLGSLLRAPLCRLRSDGSRGRSRRWLRLFFADDQLFLFGLHYLRAEFVVLFQPRQLVVVFEIILQIHSILPWGNPPRRFGAGCCAAGVNARSNACAVVIVLAGSCQAFLLSCAMRE